MSGPLPEWERKLLEEKAREEWSPTVDAVAREVHPAIAEALVDVFATPADRDFAADMVLLAHQAGIGRGRLETLLEAQRRRQEQR